MTTVNFCFGRLQPPTLTLDVRHLPSAHLISIDALRAFGQALRSLGSKVSVECPEMRERVHQYLAHAKAEVEESEAELDEAVENLRCVEDNADDDSERRAMEDAKDKLRRARRRLVDIELASCRFLSVLSNSAGNLDALFTSSHQFVQDRVGAEVRYHLIKGDAVNVVRIDASMPRESLVPLVSTEPLEAFTRERSVGLLPPLPRKMQWVPIDEIDFASIPDNLEFRKAACDDMRTMMQVFERWVLPALMKDPSLPADSFPRAQSTTVGALSNSPRFAYECMLGNFGVSDLVVVDAKGLDGQFKRGITSGRHRIKIAKELGWTHIPARVLGGSNA